MRVYELARELGLSGDELLEKFEGLGLKPRNRLSGMTEDEISKVRGALGGKKTAPATAKKAATTPKKAKPGKQAAKKPAAKKSKALKPAAKKHAVGEVPPADKKDREEVAEAERKRRKIRPKRVVVDEIELEPKIQQLPSRYVPPASIQRYPRRSARRQRPRRSQRAAQAAAKRETKFEIEAPLSVKEFSAITGVRANAIILKLMQAGEMATINAMLNRDQVELLGAELKLDLAIHDAATAEDVVTEIETQSDRPEDLKLRPPVVTFLGHVDHGKTSLLDYIRKANVVAGEHGGITQHIGAYRVNLGGNTVVFVDTPGHEAFTTMRARGANVTDIVTLIVAADDGVMPQTEEAIDHARAADVPIVVAINKCDKPNADPNRVKQQLTQLGLQPEEWGGDTVTCEVSAITGQGVDELVEMLALVAELRELKANPNAQARGTVLEAEISDSQGPMATLIVQNGTLHIGDVIVCGGGFGRIKALLDDRGKPIHEAGPASPVTVAGLDQPPGAGDQLVVLNDLQKARAVAEERRQKARAEAVTRRTHVSLENLFTAIEEGEVRELCLILKADARGSLEALSQILEKINSQEIAIKVLRASVGGISVSDVLLADASNAIIVGLHVTADGVARAKAEEVGVSIHVYNVIYRVKEEIERALIGMLKPEEREVVTGHAEVRRIFRISRLGNIAGCYVTDGTIARNNQVRLVREGAVIHEGRLASLKREKDDAREVREGFECGIHIDSYNDIKEGDVIESFAIEKIQRTLDSEPVEGKAGAS